MAERQTSDPRRSDERRQAPRDDTQRRQAPRDDTQRRQALRDDTQRRQAPRDDTQRRQAPRDGTQRRQAPSRRNDVIRCENCGEDYSITYKRCPFCDERPGRGGVSGKRVANTRGGGYGRPASALKVAIWIISFLVILCAALIVIRFIGAPLFGAKTPGSSSSSSQNGGVSSSQQSNSSASGNTSAPPASSVESVVLDTLDVTLDNGATRQLTASLLPAGAEGSITWTSSDPSVATVDANGLVTNVNAGSAQAQATITASCGAFSAQCTVTCAPQAAGNTSVSGRQGTIVADGGLNIRSGPGREHSVVASAANGATVTILGEENGWYQVRYNGSSTGYVSKDFVSVG
ncbi:MAG: SH3 domain-containing protein [Lawsonibacter sp.]|nr:SH3 domain-containing protein [Lawsonibacter sp.]